ncbi:hypothetical protein [Micromonospora palomenae]|uniref:hypothetical protein n=1 Tax=Micromonospora palomenae TaxID=1461247 RepID=UPI003F8B1079
MTHSEQRRPELVVGLVATPPDHPARVAARLTAELAGRLSERVGAGVRWTVREGWGEVAPRRDGGVEALLDDLAQRRTDDRWDVALCLTDLPLHTERVPLVAQTSARRRVAMVSLPALGLGQLRAARAAVPDLVSRLLTDASDCIAGEDSHDGCCHPWKPGVRCMTFRLRRAARRPARRRNR